MQSMVASERNYIPIITDMNPNGSMVDRDYSSFGLEFWFRKNFAFFFKNPPSLQIGFIYIHKMKTDRYYGWKPFSQF